MPRFPVTFRRKSTAAEDPNGPIAEHSFRVLERSEVSSGKSFDGGARLARMTAAAPKPNIHHSDLAAEDNLFAGLKNNRGSGSSNTTKTASDNSSRHSNASTAPSSTDFTQQEDWRNSAGRKHTSMAEGPAPPPHKNGGGFLKQAGRTFSFGNKKTSLPTIPAEESVPAVPSMPDEYSPGTPRGGRSRAETASTTSTATPPKVEDRDFMLDLGGDLSSMLKFDKRASVATLKGLMSNRVSQPAPLNIDNTAPVEPPQHSWNSQHSNDGLLSSGRTLTSPPAASELRPPPVPRHHTTPLERRRSDEDDEDTTLLRDSIAATQFLSSEESGPSGGSTRYRRDEDEVSELRSSHADSYSKSSRFGAKVDDDNMFDRPLSRPRYVPRQNGRTNSQPQNKVMTPAEFEKYRQDKAREEIMGLNDDPESDKEEEDNYDDDEDEREKTRQLAKQRKKQEAHMTVYRQQMMKVTGETGNANSNANTNANMSGHASHPSISLSVSAPNLVLNDGPSKGVSPSPPSDGSESDEEVPLAILAAHGFPNKNRPPTRLTTMSSNPNLRASVQQPSYVSGPGSVMGESVGANGGRLPPFARRLPQDPYLGAGLINQPPRESFALGGGVAAPNPPVPTGGLVGVIANEERSRAMRRGSPALDNTRSIQANGMRMNGGFDPINGIPPQMMYPMGMPQMPNQMLTPSDQMQMQMSQQMQQFMQMQMQFMQMMTDRGQGQEQMQGSLRPQGHTPTHSMGSLGEIPRGSFMGDMMGNNMMGNNMGNGMNLDLPRGDNQMRTMSMVQPSSASWLQPPQNGYAPSIRAQGQGYAPSIAPSERSNIGLPGRYRPVSSATMLDHGRTSSMSGALPTLHSKLQAEVKVSPMNNKEDDDDDEQGWEAMKAKREKKKSIWRTKKTFGDDIGALIN
ncbi:uncharacterized protein F4807DRAFT_109900 [Annulohypoxylon truncatum]|uniref:uncharacterized protein n=1 Tax=Annulohypoxylon truncatum TaxID=327061 RepID=UPI0020076C9C|nr:uncharacterized protein F4807DRAFT_109900 [Annulohypoxylon truncatum]KAI1209089.1 hypothetical protein F4807DRAFT_109900 [Annulohypoxylon truncatum]